MNASTLTSPAGRNSMLDANAQSTMANAKGISRDDSTGKILDSARQLEAMFLGMMFNEMAKTVSKEDSIFPTSPGDELYQEWFRTEVAKEWASTGGAGIGNTIAKAMGVDQELINAHRTNTFRGPDYIRNMARNPSRAVRTQTPDSQLRRFTENTAPIRQAPPQSPIISNIP